MVEKGMDLQSIAKMLDILPAHAQRYVDLGLKRVSLENI